MEIPHASGAVENSPCFIQRLSNEMLNRNSNRIQAMEKYGIYFF